MKTLRRKQLPLYALAGFGPNLLNTILTIYLVDALQTAGFGLNVENWTFFNKTIIAVGIFSVLKFLAQLIDGIIDVPFAALTDNLKSRWGKRRPVMFIGTIVMLAAYLLFCFPISQAENSLANTFYFGGLLIFFFSAYTLTMVTYYGTYAEVTENEKDRFFLSNFKAFIDTVQYALAYALIPVFVGFNINIRMIGLIVSPLALTVFIAIFLIKERSTRKEDVEKYNLEHPEEVNKLTKEEEVPIFESIKLTVKNRDFVFWLLLLACFFFGLQMFLSGQNVLASGPMGLNGWQIAIINTAAFAPVPIMLVIYRKIMKKKGFRFAFQTALIAFAVAMLAFSFAYVNWIDNVWIRLAIGATGGTIGSYGIGAFFAAPYLVPSQAAADEHLKTGKSHPSMYFAVQGLATASVGALSTGLLWPNLRNIAVGENTLFGAHLMPYIVIVFCLAAFFIAFALPKSYEELGKEKKEESIKSEE